MFPYMRAQWFIDTAYVSDLFQITVHPLVTGYRQDHSFFQAFRMCLVLLQNHPWNVQQWNVTHVVRLFPGFSYPVLAIDILYYVFISQVLYIGKGQPGQRTKHEYVPDRLQAGNGEFIFQKYVQFILRKERPVRFCLFKMNLQKRIVRYPFVHKRHFYYLLEVFQIFYRGILGT